LSAFRRWRHSQGVAEAALVVVVVVVASSLRHHHHHHHHHHGTLPSLFSYLDPQCHSENGFDVGEAHEELKSQMAYDSSHTNIPPIISRGGKCDNGEGEVEEGKFLWVPSWATD